MGLVPDEEAPGPETWRRSPTADDEEATHGSRWCGGNAWPMEESRQRARTRGMYVAPSGGAGQPARRRDKAGPRGSAATAAAAYEIPFVKREAEGAGEQERIW